MTETDPDPKGLIRESYRIDGISEAECRSIFLDWALSIPVADPRREIEVLLTMYGAEHPDHPMTGVLAAGLERTRVQGRRGGRQGRRPPGDEAP